MVKRSSGKRSVPAGSFADGADLAELTEEQVRDQTDDGSFSRGRSYHRSDRIFDTVRRVSTLQARCRGSSGGPYLVSATLAVAGEATRENPVEIGCDCPRGGFCKHVVALLLTWIGSPERFAPRPSIDELLADKSRDELAAVLRLALREHPELESLLELPMAGVGASSARVDEIAVRREVATAFSELNDRGAGGWYGDDGWGAPDRVAGKLQRLIAIGDGYVEAGQWRNAAAVFATIAEETVGYLETVQDEEGCLAGIAVACDAGLARALDGERGAADGETLTEEERERAIEALYEIWQTDVEIGGIDLAQEGPAAIARAGTPEEQRRVAGWLRESIEASGGGDASHGWAKRAAIGFLSMLAGDAGLSDDELVAAYREAELWEEATESLLQMGRIEEGIGMAARRLTSAPGLLRFADRLAEMDDGGRAGQAIALVDARLWEREGEQPHEDQQYLAWLEGRYAVGGFPEKALETARKRFAATPTHATYEAVRRVAELPGQPAETWPSLRSELLATLRKRGEWGSLIEAHLGAGEVAEAVGALGKLGPRHAASTGWGQNWTAGSYAQRVALAAEQAMPEESVRLYRSLAEREIEGRRRATYREAAAHLARVKALLERDGKHESWRDLIGEVRQRNKSLRALREELDALDLA